MSFTSLSFVLFLLAVVVCYYVLPAKCQKYILFLGSIVFYLFGGIKAFILLFLSAIVTYVGARMLGKWQEQLKRKAILVITIVFNLSLLIGLKYFGGYRESLGLVLPIGISFYTLSAIGYVIDVYRNKYCPETNILDFLLYITYFPHILQGPIARYDGLKSQFDKKHVFSYKILTSGVQLMLWGYIKKLVIADRVAIFVDSVYSNINTQSGTILFVASILYTIQIYMDFSGCVDIALGASEIFGIELIQNFKQPYLSNSINDFWRRWHISLSSWFRDYLYIPLGGNRKGNVRRWINVLIVFTVSGFWHGVGINYIIWGLLHGIYQVLGAVFMPVRERIRLIFKIDAQSFIYKKVEMVITFLLVNFAWIFFRLTNVKDAFHVVKEIFTDWTPWVLTNGVLSEYGVSSNQWHVVLGFMVIAGIVDVLHERGIHIRTTISKQNLIVRWAIYGMAVFSIVLFGVYGVGYDATGFIYMNF